LGQTKRINLKSGASIQGVVSESEGKYQIETRFGVVTVEKDKVLSIEDVVTPEEDYQRRLASIDPNNAEDHYGIARWAFDNGHMEIARKELSAALKLNKDYELAALLLRRVEAKLAVEAPTTRRAETAPGGGPLPGQGAWNADWLVTDEEAYRIRLEELRATDRVRVQFRQDVLNRFLNMMQGRYEFREPRFADTFRAWPPVTQVLYIVDKVDRNDVAIKNDITIMNDPQFMRDFRSRVWPVIASSCGSAGCHGGAKPVGGFRLLSVVGKSDKVHYTNFLILDDYVSGGRKMIDRDNPDQSLMLQFGLPEDLAQQKHPGKIHVTFTSRRDANYRRVLDWIDALNGPPHPEYRVKLRVPWAVQGPSAPETQPATAPAGGESPG
jgi:hypothetical protein